jgi:hypothetical protein
VVPTGGGPIEVIERRMHAMEDQVRAACEMGEAYARKPCAGKWAPRALLANPATRLPRFVTAVSLLRQRRCGAARRINRACRRWTDADAGGLGERLRPCSERLAIGHGDTERLALCHVGRKQVRDLDARLARGRRHQLAEQLDHAV